MTAQRGTVRNWNVDDGWGVVDVDAVDGGVWVHFSAIEGRPSGYLVVGEPVTVEWQDIPHPPCVAEATRAVVDGPHTPLVAEPGDGVLNSVLTIRWDADRSE